MKMSSKREDVKLREDLKRIKSDIGSLQKMGNLKEEMNVKGISSFVMGEYIID